ncbi:MAG: LPS export ABC transporter periplasmic protein LptC [Propylenella sp.]
MSISASFKGREARLPASARRKAFRAARRHSRNVRLLRILLPAAGVATIAALFVLTRLGLPIALDLSNARLSITPNAVIMEHPNLTGFDGERREYSVAAERAIQSLANPNEVRLEAIKASIGIAEQGVTTIVAGAGLYDHEGRRLRLEGNVSVDSAGGYALRMTDADIDFLGGTMQSAHPVTVIYADSEVTGQRFFATDGGKRVLFEGGVRTIVMPPKRKATQNLPAERAE